MPHHAKAGNINHTLLKGGVVRGDYVLVLDSDMLVHPDFLMSAMGHMYEEAGGKWRPKPKAGFVQIPQVGCLQGLMMWVSHAFGHLNIYMYIYMCVCMYVCMGKYIYEWVYR